ncbi:MAG TPA: FlgD immunoglobulin-like domain containing protein [Methylomirabilota bacterium]|nr:FlgD immunoglobulin-like domain containing protein [Methylomirabilota bacterium]
MSKMFTRFLAVAALVCTTGVASATQFPNATCPDSVTIQQIQDVTHACHPALGDTVAGVSGVIIGFDPIATGFDAYIQDPAGGPFSGIDFFTHSVNTKVAPYNFAIGDRIVVEFAATAEFNSATEVLAANNNFGAPNFIVRKVSSGNALPPFFVGTTTQMQQNNTNTFFEQYEGCLVKVNGPMTVVRTSLTGGMGFNSFLVISAGAPSDSVYIDGGKLTSFAPPPIGTNIVSVQGIGQQNTSSGVNTYRIMLRDGNDIVTFTPPNVSDAYPRTDNTVFVKFDRNVTVASAQNTSNYSLASFGSVNSAVMSGTDAVILGITNGLGHGDLETVTVNGVVGLASGAAMTTPQSLTFVNGVLTAEEVQRANPDSLAATNPPCLDRSRFAGGGGQISQGGVGTRATMAATVAARYGSIYYMMDPGNVTRGGLAAFAPPAVLTTGNKYRLVGQVQEFFGETEFSNIIEATDQGAAGVPAPKLIAVIQASRDTCDFTNTLKDGEDYEGRLVTLGAVKVVQRFLTPPTNGFHVADQSFPDTIFVENFNGVLTPLNAPTLGHVVNLTGVVHYSGGSFRIVPRGYSDIVDLGVAGVGGPGGHLAFSVAPNPSRKPTFSFTLPQEADVDIGIYDVAGRQVASVFKGALPAGSYSRDWSGQMTDGRTASAGVYFARMNAGGVSKTLQTVFLGN